MGGAKLVGKVEPERNEVPPVGPVHVKVVVLDIVVMPAIVSNER